MVMICKMSAFYATRVECITSNWILFVTKMTQYCITTVSNQRSLANFNWIFWAIAPHFQIGHVCVESKLGSCSDTDSIKF